MAALTMPKYAPRPPTMPSRTKHGVTAVPARPTNASNETPDTAGNPK